MEGSRINLNLLGIKAMTKNEITGFLQPKLICICLLKKKHQSTLWETSFKAGKGKPLFSHFLCSDFYMEQVKPRSVPQIKELRVEDFVYFIETEVDNGIDYLPQNYKEITLNRQWIVNLCTLLIILL